MIASKGQSRRFKQVMHLIIALGIGTNVSIATLLVFLSAKDVLFSPIIGTLIFIVSYLLMRNDILTVKTAFIITAYTVAVEVVIHTHYLGWDSGFFYFLYAISLVFLLDYSWKIRSVILFNGSIIGITIATAIIYRGKPGVHILKQNYIDNLSFFNQSVIGIVILTITIYFSHTNRNKDRDLQLANLELEAQNKEIVEQRNHLQLLLMEIHHRVKNNLQIISSLLSLQSRSVKNENTVAILNESQRRVEAIALIHQNLYHNNQGNQVDFKAYLQELVTSQQIVQSNIKCNINSTDSVLNLDIAVPLGLIISEMITNSVKHAFEETDKPEINISFFKTANEFELQFSDNGKGLPKDFSLSQSESLGIEIVTALIEQIDAKIDYHNDNGANFKIRFNID